MGKIELVPIDLLLYVQGAGAYSELVLENGSRHLHDKTLDKLNAILPAAFERIHKSYLVRITAVAALHALGGSRYEAELKSGVRLPIGRSRYKDLRGRLK
jgi:DNA-binding LytR/AlgR family response regulator